MTQKDSANRPAQEGSKDPLFGRSYLCCSGPLKGEAVTVMGQVEEKDKTPSLRYRLESERGVSWMISPERLRRIFGPSAKRTCQCHPIDAEPQTSVAEIEKVADEATAEDLAEPSEAVDTAEETLPEDEATTIESEQPVEATQVIYDGENAQGLLFC